MSNEPRRVRMAVNWGTVATTGLIRGAVVEVLPVPDDARVWVHCPAIPRKTSNGFKVVSDGYAPLLAGEYEEL